MFLACCFKWAVRENCIRFQSLAWAVGHNENSLSFVRRAKHLRRNSLPVRREPAFANFGEYCSKPPPSKCCDVFHDKESRHNRANDADVFSPQAAPGPVCPFGAVIVGADVLTRKSAADNVNAPVAIGREGSHVVPAPHVGPVFGEHSSAERVNFHLPFADHSGPLKTEIEAAYAREQGAER